jgi:hypothetical protein
MIRPIVMNQSANRSLTTEELAAVLAIRPQSLRKRLSQTGSYFGIRPVKLPNRQLRWPADSVALLTREMPK